MARILQRASQPVHPLLEPAKELRPGQQLEGGWSTHQVIYNCNLFTVVIYLYLLFTYICNLLPVVIHVQL
jgi:hypothetical protein